MNENELERAVETTIKLLRFLSQGEGLATISVWDAGAGGGFSFGEVHIGLERSGLSITEKVYTVDEFKSLLLGVGNPFEFDEDTLNRCFADTKWKYEESE